MKAKVRQKSKLVEAWAIVEDDGEIRCGVFGPRTSTINSYIRMPAHKGMRLVQLIGFAETVIGSNKRPKWAGK